MYEIIKEGIYIMKYIFIDTNIYIYCALLTNLEYKSDTIDSLISFLKRKDVRLLFPDVVKLEFLNKSSIVYDNMINSKIDLVKKIQNITFPEYFIHQKKQIINDLNESLDSSRENLKRTTRILIEDILNLKNTIYLTSTSETMLNSYKRALEGKKPYNRKLCTTCGEMTQPLNVDCIIIEMLKEFFIKNMSKHDELLFCTNNTKDFAVFNNINNKHEICEEIKKDLILDIKFFNSLPKLLEEEGKYINKEDKVSWNELDLINNIQNILNQLGISSQCTGYKFLVQAIYWLYITFSDNICLRDAYNEVANINNTTSISIYHSIRHAIKKSCNKEGCALLKKGLYESYPTDKDVINYILNIIRNNWNI